MTEPGPFGDVICAWCGTSWDVDGLRREGWELLSDGHAVVLDVLRQFAHARSGDQEFQREVSRHVYDSLIAGHGCPSPECGFEHGPEDGPYRQQQLERIASGDTTDGVS